MAGTEEGTRSVVAQLRAPAVVDSTLVFAALLAWFILPVRTVLLLVANCRIGDAHSTPAVKLSHWIAYNFRQI